MANNLKKNRKKFNIKDFFRFSEKGNGVDMPMLVITLILLGFGLVMLYSASYVRAIYTFDNSLYYISDQVIFAIIGLSVMAFISTVDYKILKNFDMALYAVVIVLLVIVLFMQIISGVSRWIIIPGIGSFQPSEIAKFAIILVYAKLIERNYNKMKDVRYGIVPFVIVLGIILTLLFLQPHLSAIIIITGIAGVMMLVGGSDIKWFTIAIALVAVVVVTVLILYPDSIHYAEDRIYAWLNPESDLQGDGYQSYQSLLAIGSGGLFGLGLSNSRQKHLHLPEPQNDFIFAVICEELGFIGGMLVIILFLALLYRGFYIAVKAKDRFGAMLVVGVVAQITIQAFLNIAVATNTVPNTGISLPFFSAGGTSLMMLLAEMGVVLSVSRTANLNKD